MLFKSITLENIRSYVKQSISFEDGITLLLGDIGSGKSTILLAIEFALFGILRGEGSGNLLLRHGCKEGSVTLHLIVEGKDVIITRNLKRTKQGIVQDAGSLTLGSITEQYTPLELKAHIVEILGYPPEFIMKSNALLYRYTVYCPQEEMAAILNDDGEARLNTIRIIFNLDKYKRIVENAAGIIKDLKARKLVLQERAQGLDADEEQATIHTNTLKNLDEQERNVLDHKDIIDNELKALLQQLALLEQQHEEKNRLHQHLQFTQERAIEKQQQIVRLEQELVSIVARKKDIIIEHTIALPEAKLALENVEQEHKRILLKMQAAKARMQERQTIIDKEPFLKGQLAIALAKEKEYQDQVAIDDTIALEELEIRHAQLLAINRTAVQQKSLVQDKLNNFTQLTTCPTCLQPLNEQHKHNVQQELNQQLITLAKQVQDAANEDLQVEQQLNKLKHARHARQTAEKELVKIQQLIINYNEHLSQISQAREEHAGLQQLLNQLHPETSEPIIAQLRAAYDLALQTEQLKARHDDLCRREQHIQQDLRQAMQMLKELSAAKEQTLEKLVTLKELPSITDKKDRHTALQQKRTELIAMQTGINKEKILLRKQAQQLDDIIAAKKTARLDLERMQTMLHWLDSFFIPAVEAIEKYTLQTIFQQCNESFVRWTTMMLDDAISARLDENFAPVIEQNGYESTIANLSGGERTSVALAYRLALHQVINTFVTGIKTRDVLILDEPTDGFSSEQLDKMPDLFAQLATRQVILVSHETKMENFVNRIVRVSKVDHESCI